MSRLPCQDLGMPYKIRLNNVFMRPEVKNRFDLAGQELSWAAKTQMQQCIKAYFRENLEAYLRYAEMDYKARGMTEKTYFSILLERNEDDLAPYINDRRPVFGSTPLAEIPSITGLKIRVDTISSSAQNLVFLRVAKIVDDVPLTQIISKIIDQHFMKHWDSNYWPHIRRGQLRKFRLSEDDLYP